MFYIYRSFSVAGWIAAAVFFAFLLGFLWGQRHARRRGPDESPGFEVTPAEPAAEKTPPPAPTVAAADQTDAKHP